MNPVRNLEQGQSLDPQDPHKRFERLTQSARIEGQSVWLELLRDRVEWNACPKWAQDEAIKAVAVQLGSQFSYHGANNYECGGQSHRIGQFEHIRTGARLNLLPGGSYEMGGQRTCELPIHIVTPKPFLIGTTPVTQSQWDRIGGSDQRDWWGPQRPIQHVSTKDVRDWLDRAGGGLSLPSEAEWEYACRAGTQSEFCFGDDSSRLTDYAWTAENSGGETHEVGALKPNAFGLYDVHGNVWEYCEDLWNEGYIGAPTDGSARKTGPLSEMTVVRGGNFWL